MVPKLGSKPNTRARVLRAPTKVSELDVTPSSESSLSLSIKPSFRKGYGNDRVIRVQIRREQNIQKVKMGSTHQDDPSCRLLDNRIMVLDNFPLSARVAQMGSIHQDGPFLWDTETLWKGICSDGTLYSAVAEEAVESHTSTKNKLLEAQQEINPKFSDFETLTSFIPSAADDIFANMSYP
ncbi:hypothetical protein TGAM01_v202177 [Trichoderma gamsii]|uniref:Uncharacterized protein n=1 Tax=Trichoderma gamsii TaxID=398673 RepID=A0A2P4ZXP0_9HYPO|nr:hypothetical protein TGAM01_v202177 [Trichoderma gamsii]PON29069.1 hypothetical protein TGAM01_v202177 [Trichoderma gamsii]